MDTLGCHYPGYHLWRVVEANLVAALRRQEVLEAGGGGGDGDGRLCKSRLGASHQRILSADPE